jgi:hypothetical protein
VRHSLVDIFPYVDVLGGNHLVAIAGTLGLLPLWVTAEIEVHRGRSITWLLTNLFPEKKERLKIKVDDVISNVMVALTTQCEDNFMRRTVENIACKVFCWYTKNNRDALFQDILLPKQNLYSVNQNEVRVMLADGRMRNLSRTRNIHCSIWCPSVAGISLWKDYMTKFQKIGLVGKPRYLD